MSQDRVIERVRKLLALANDAAATEGERDNALRMAYATLAKHNIDLASVGSTQPQEKREEQRVRMSVYPWARGIAHSIAGLFFCEYYYSRAAGKNAEHYFVGRTSNAITASEMSQYVIESVFKELRKRFGSETSPDARAFAMGVEAALRTRCNQMKRAATDHNAPQTAQAVSGAAGGALVPADFYKTETEANRAWMTENVPGLKTAKDRTKDVRIGAYAAGKGHGKTISLNAQVGAAKNSTRRLT